MRTGYFGDESSHTYACALENESGELVGYPSIAAVVAALDDGEVDSAVVPLENSVGGTVGDTLDALKNAGVYIVEQYHRRIFHSLIGVIGAKKSDIKRIYSHPQALAQCDRYLRENFSEADVIAVASTSAALKIVSSPEEAAIARVATEGLAVLDAEIEDNKHNVTRFVRLSRAPRFGGKKAAIVFGTPHRPGELLKVLEVLAAYKLNLNKLESRPSRDGEFGYWFFAEFDCPQKSVLDMVMRRLVAESDGFVRLVGCY